MPVFEKRSRIAAPASVVFAFHERPDALERLSPPWESMRVVSKTPGLAVGTRVVLETKIGFLTQRVVAEHTRYEPGYLFVDEMREGPFARWTHTHTVEPDGENASWLIDHVEYALPLGALGQAAAGWFVRRKLERLFTFRHAATSEACTAARAAGAGLG